VSYLRHGLKSPGSDHPFRTTDRCERSLV